MNEWFRTMVCTNVSAGKLHSSVAIHIGQQAQAEALRVRWVCEAVYC